MALYYWTQSHRQCSPHSYPSPASEYASDRKGLSFSLCLLASNSCSNMSLPISTILCMSLPLLTITVNYNRAVSDWPLPTQGESLYYYSIAKHRAHTLSLYRYILMYAYCFISFLAFHLSHSIVIFHLSHFIWEKINFCLKGEANAEKFNKCIKSMRRLMLKNQNGDIIVYDPENCDMVAHQSSTWSHANFHVNLVRVLAFKPIPTQVQLNEWMNDYICF